ncbi:hypothetical protein HNQ94_002432 [Salirhabdus euzebyi]|uniref:Uncharacterized protein n=1 Tax=Salirhabdus euzebyi TaxID=394506 RepID=A0A841Q6F3_9BACI|nr:hypothetical protein [Salirhabdus euzebyi]MBB6453981.1 hypothetical protein [Salirhabdus euzebyi]
MELSRVAESLSGVHTDLLGVEAEVSIKGARRTWLEPLYGVHRDLSNFGSSYREFVRSYQE